MKMPLFPELERHQSSREIRLSGDRGEYYNCCRCPL